jgi:hypothetical protein
MLNPTEWLDWVQQRQLPAATIQLITELLQNLER